MNWLLQYFRPHIIFYKGKYYVRRREDWFFWVYLSSNTLYHDWYSDVFIYKCDFSSEKEAETKYHEYKKYIKEKKLASKLNKESIKKIL